MRRFFIGKTRRTTFSVRGWQAPAREFVVLNWDRYKDTVFPQNRDIHILKMRNQCHSESRSEYCTISTEEQKHSVL